jgi:hypothetical protein
VPSDVFTPSPAPTDTSTDSGGSAVGGFIVLALIAGGAIWGVRRWRRR